MSDHHREADDSVDDEERAIYLIVVAGAAPIAIGVLVSSGSASSLGGGNTLAIGLGVLALAGLVSSLRWFRRARVPVARVLRR